MKIKLLYFFKKNKLKILLGALFIVFVLLAVFLYHILFKIEKKEEIVFTTNEEIKITEEKEKEIKTKSYYVDIKGEIKNPGVYLLEEGKRVIDVIEQAGGLTEQADTSVNNLSRKIKDEMVIIIYSKEQVEEFASTKEEEENLLNEIQEEERQENNAVLKEEEIESSVKPSEDNKKEENNQESLKDGKISINTATKEELMTLSGIGEKKAEAILSYREEHGSFTSIEELLNVNGIGEAIFNQIKDSIKL